MFQLAANKTSVRTELLAGLTTYLTMAYIVVVNPAILAPSGIDPGAAFVATCIAAAVGSAAMGLFANLPLALAPGMGLNAFFTFTLVKGMGVSWQVALGVVFLSGVLFLIVSLFRVIAHPTPGTGLVGSFVASTKRRTSSTEARLAFAVLTRERKAA